MITCSTNNIGIYNLKYIRAYEDSIIDYKNMLNEVEYFFNVFTLSNMSKCLHVQLSNQGYRWLFCLFCFKET